MSRCAMYAFFKAVGKSFRGKVSHCAAFSSRTSSLRHFFGKPSPSRSVYSQICQAKLSPLREQTSWPKRLTGGAIQSQVPIYAERKFSLRGTLSEGRRDWYHHDNKQRQSFNGESPYFNRLLLLASISGIYLVLSNDEVASRFSKSGLLSFIETISPAFVVNAAKPFFNDDETIKGDQDNGKGGSSRRMQFNFIADVLEVVEDAVVCIEVKEHSHISWFGMPQTASNGSGFIVKEDGMILTNAHVVASQEQCSITVKLKDGRCFAGFVEDVDYESDLATLRVKARGLPTLKLGCSSETRVGEWVVAVGSPLNLSNTVTAGIVSTTRKAHELGINQNDINYIQTDAAITFGNSGGPLINLDCEVIGINSMKVTPGISFAIPIDHAKSFLEKAEKRRANGHTRSRKAYMGLTILSLTEQIRRELQSRTGVLVVNHGVFVWQVVRGGPAYLAGIQPGDVMTSINGQQISSASQVHDMVKTYDKLVIEVQRGNHFHKLTVVPETVVE